MENHFDTSKKKNVNDLFEQIELLIEAEEENQAIEQLVKAQQQYPSEYIVCMFKLINLYSAKGEKRKIEMTYQRALEEIQDKKDRWIILASFAAYYKEQHMYLKMGKLSKQLISEYPDNYLGYHLHVLIEIDREHYAEAENYMNKIHEKFHEYAEFLADYIDLLEKKGDVDGLFDYIDHNSEVMEIIPAYALKKKIKILSLQKRYNEVDRFVFILAVVYGDYDAILSMMILCFMKENFELSMRVAGYILNRETEPKTYHYYLAKLFQTFNLYMLQDKHPHGKTKTWILDSIAWLKEYLKIQEIENVDMDRFLNDIRERLEKDKE